MSDKNIRTGLYKFILNKLSKDFNLKSKNNLFKIKEIGGERASAGIASIFIPQDVSREEYVNKCLRTNSISLINEYERLDNVIISQNLINSISFPEGVNELGSNIVWVKTYPLSQLVAVGIINKKDEVILDKENQIYFIKENKDLKIKIIGNPENRFLNIEIENKGNIKSEINLKITGDNKNSKLNINSSGYINIISGNQIKLITENELNLLLIDKINNKNILTLKYIKGSGLYYKDEFNNLIEINEFGKNIKIGSTNFHITQTGYISLENNEISNFYLNLNGNIINLLDEKINIIPKKEIIIGDEDNKEKMVIGKTLNDNLSELIDINNDLINLLTQIASTDLSTATSMGLSYASSLNSQLPFIINKYTSLKQKLDNHLSDFSTLSKSLPS